MRTIWLYVQFHVPSMLESNLAYLPQEERRIEILEAVLRVAAIDGFAAATARRIGSNLNISAGNVHHHFTSSQELKREAFRYFADKEFARIEAETEGTSSTERLIPYLCFPAEETTGRIDRLWNAALDEAARDEAFAEVYAAATKLWHGRVAKLVADETDGTLDRGQAEAVAWRLLALSTGLDGFSRVAGLGLSAADSIGHITMAIAHELHGGGNSYRPQDLQYPIFWAGPEEEE